MSNISVVSVIFALCWIVLTVTIPKNLNIPSKCETK